MAKRKTKNSTELYEFLMQRVDRRTNWGKRAAEVLEAYRDQSNTMALSLLKSLVLELQTDNLADVCALDDEFYKKGVKERCVCGRGLSKEVYLMGYRPGTLAQEEIISVISTGKSIKGTKDYIPIGSSCHKNLPSILEELGEPRLKRRIESTPEKHSQELEDILMNISPELRKKLENAGIDVEQLEKVLSLEHAQALVEGDESGVLFDMDPGTNRSSYNWFREELKAGDIEDSAVHDIWHKLNNASHLVNDDELATIALYSYEFRPRATDVLLAGVKDDLLYLSSLPDNHPHIKGKGRINIDKNYVHPQTKYRKRKDLKKRTIRDVLNQDKVTRVEAMGIHRHFPGIVDRRVDTNRKIAQSYGLGRHWDYLLRDIGPTIDEMREEFAEEYREYGEILKEYVLTQKEYLTAKNFLKRSRIGKQSARENYLRMYSIRAFENVAPIIIKVGRKLRFARRRFEKTGDDWLKQGLIKQDYFLNEEINDRFEQLTGIDEPLDFVVDMLANARYISNGNILRFQKEHADLIEDMHKNGLVAKRYFKPTGKSKLCALKRYFDLMEEEGVRELTSQELKKAEKIKEYISLPYVDYPGIDLHPLKGIRFASRTGIDRIAAAYWRLLNALQGKSYSDKDVERFRDNLAQMKKTGRILYIRDGGDSTFLDTAVYDPNFMKRKEGEVALYDVERVNDAMDNVASAVEIDKDLLAKVRELHNHNNLRVLGIDKPAGYLRDFEGRLCIEPAFREKVDLLYKELIDYIGPMKLSAEKREQIWKELDWSGQKELAKEFGERLYARFADDENAWSVINGLCGGYMAGQRGHKSLQRWEHPSYTSRKNEKYADLTFKIFMGDGQRPYDFIGLASGDMAAFRLHPIIRKRLRNDLENGEITKYKYSQYAGRLEMFEKKVNKILKEAYR